MALSRMRASSGGRRGAGELRGVRRRAAGGRRRLRGPAAGGRGRGARPGRSARARRRREERGAAGCGFRPPVGAERGVGDAGEMRAQPGVEGGAALGAVEDSALGLARPEEVDDRSRGVEEGLHRRRAAGAHHVVGVLARRHQREAQRARRRRGAAARGRSGAGRRPGRRGRRRGRRPARGRASRAARAGPR